MPNFGALTDHFGILAIVDGAGTLGDILELIASPKTPDPMSRADAPDENGDIAASTWYGNTAGALYEASSTFTVTSGTLDTALLKLGELSTGVVVTGIDGGTDNGGWPTITVKGKLGTEAIVAPTGKLNTWTLPSWSIVGAKRAQLIDFTVDVGTRCTSSGFAASIDLAQTPDGLGEPVAHGVSGGVCTLSANIQSVTAAPAWTLAGDWTETQAPGADEAGAAYHTGTGTAEQILERDAAA
jgi:hypothetical protein